MMLWVESLEELRTDLRASLLLKSTLCGIHVPGVGTGCARGGLFGVETAQVVAGDPK